MTINKVLNGSCTLATEFSVLALCSYTVRIIDQVYDITTVLGTT